MILQDVRILSLTDWLENDLLLTLHSCELASSDASFRRYFRVKVDAGQFIAMDAPPKQENLEAFIGVAKIMARSGIHVPAIFYENLNDGFLLLEDFGSQCFLDKINENNAAELYATALNNLFKLQTKTSIIDCQLPRYDIALLTRELAIFKEWFLEQWLDIEIPESLWQSVTELLIISALEQPQSCVHRDFHSRNLMVLDSNELGVIDFQDAVIGPVTYDLVSLLRDCYIVLPEQQVATWRKDYYSRLQASGLITCSLPQFIRWFDLMGMQRHLKAIGIFSRLNLRDAKSNYLQDIPRTLAYVCQQTQTYPEFSNFHEFLQHAVLPRIIL